MKLNKALAYGLACLAYLGEHDNGQWHRAKIIAEFQGLPAGYCVKVLRALISAGFVESGQGCGYRLKKDLDEISAWELMEAFIFKFNCAADTAETLLPFNLHKTLHATVNHWLVGLTVRDIVEMSKTKKPRNGKARKPRAGLAAVPGAGK